MALDDSIYDEPDDTQSDEESLNDEASDVSSISELDALKEQLEGCLCSADSKGSWSYHNSCKQQFVNPGLKIDRIGSIGLPLSDGDAAAIKLGHCQESFGKDIETELIERDSKIWGIKGDRVELTNPIWGDWFNTKIVSKVAEELGIEPNATKNIKAELYKILLYENNAIVRPHQE